MCARASTTLRDRAPQPSGLARPRLAALLASLLAAPLSGCFQSPVDPDERLPASSWHGEPGMAPGQFAYPRALEIVEHQGEPHLFVVDKAARIQWFAGSDWTQSDSQPPRALWQTPRFDRGKPTGIAVHFDPADPEALPTLYIADTHESRILVQRPPASLDDEPTTIRIIGSYGYEPGQFIYPCDIALLTADDGTIERFYVSEYGGNDRINVFDADWNHLLSFGTFGNAWEEDGLVFNRPQAIEIDANERVLYVADAINHRVGRFTLDGEHLGWLGEGTPSDEPGSFEFPYSVAVAGPRKIAVAEFGNSRVQILDAISGQRLALFGGSGRGPDDLLNPWEVAVLGDRLFVLDSGNARISTFDLPPLQAIARSEQRHSSLAARAGDGP